MNSKKLYAVNMKMSDKYKIRPKLYKLSSFTKNNKLNVNEDELENISRKKLTEPPFFFTISK